MSQHLFLQIKQCYRSSFYANKPKITKIWKAIFIISFLFLEAEHFWHNLSSFLDQIILWTTFYYPQKVLHILSLGFITFPKVMHIVHRVIHKNKDFYPHSPFLQNLTHKTKSQHFVLLYLLLKFFILIHSK
jgi:hypothetical protein